MACSRESFMTKLDTFKFSNIACQNTCGEKFFTDFIIQEQQDT